MSVLLLRSQLLQGVEPRGDFFVGGNQPAALFVGEGGDSAMRLEAEYELLFTQKLILTPEIEMDFYGQNDPANNTGTGLSDMEAGLRLRYEFTRQFAPYIGVHYEKKYGNAADFARINGEEVSFTSWVIGVRAWF